MINMTNPQRVLFINIATLSMIGIWLTGFEHIHWFAYIVPAALLFAAVSGYCVGMDIARGLLRLAGVNK